MRDPLVARLIEACKSIVTAGHYNDDGDFVLPHAGWDGQCDPPDTSEPAPLTEMGEALAALVEVA